MKKLDFFCSFNVVSHRRMKKLQSDHPAVCGDRKNNKEQQITEGLVMKT